MNTNKKTNDLSENTLLKSLFGIDLRSLALFRIALAVLILVNLTERFGVVTAFFSDAGVLPRAQFFNQYRGVENICFFAIHGRPLLISAAIVIEVFLAIALMLGYRTKLVTFISWLLFTSLNIRYPMIRDCSDSLLNILLFWSIFLPSATKYSIDSALNSSNKTPPPVHFSLSTVALYVQIIFVYLFTSLALKHDTEWLNGNAILNLSISAQYGTPLSTYLAEHLPHAYLKLITHSVIWLEFLSPILFLSPIFTSRIRIFSIAAFTLLNLCLIVFFDNGHLPWINMAALIVFLPKSFWDLIDKKNKTQKRLEIKIYFDGMCGFCKKMVLIIRTFFLIPETRILPAQDDLKVYDVMQKENSWVVIDHNGIMHIKYDAFLVLCENSPILCYLLPILRAKSAVETGTAIYEKIASNRFIGSKLVSSLKFREINTEQNKYEKIFVAICLLLITLLNTETINKKYKIPEKLRFISTALKIEQPWYKSAPLSISDTNIKWYVISGTFEDGKEYDLLHDKEGISWKKPRFIGKYYKNRFWKNYFNDSPSDPMHQGYNSNAFFYAAYACRNWNKSEDQKNKLKLVKVFLVDEKTSSEGSPEINKNLQWEQSCSAIR